MLRNKLTGLNKITLRRGLFVFFLALAIPTAILIQQSYSRLKWETFHQHQLMAEELTKRIDQQFLQLINSEQQRPFTDYAFLNVVGELEARFFQRSPLSQYPIESKIPGLIGYFQVDSAGKLMTPMVPDLQEDANYYGISKLELTERQILQNKIQTILSQNKLVKNDVAISQKMDLTIDQDNAESDEFVINSSEVGLAEEIAPSQYKGQAAFDELKNAAPSKIKPKSQYGRLEDLKLKQSYAEKEQVEQEVAEIEMQSQAAKTVAKKARTERSALPESVSKLSKKIDDVLSDGLSSRTISARKITLDEGVNDINAAIKNVRTPMRIRTFESEIDPLEFSQLDSEHFVLFRKVWLNDQRYIQGFLIEQHAFLSDIISQSFLQTSLAQMSNLLVVYQGNVLEAFTGNTSRGYLSSARELNGELLYQTRLTDPLSDIQLLFSITKLPAGPGSIVILWLALIVAFVLCIGFYLLYRLGVGQINLANQQQDFVSAVSHELKTPLTSIRMYGEVLREGWASEEKKKTYYDFIFDESERLSRLINNVLLMAKMTRNKHSVDLKKLRVASLIDGVKSKVSTQIERAGFELALNCSDDVGEYLINVDADLFSQIMINLVDNALKFSAHAERKIVEVQCQSLSNNTIQFSVRDYGPGVEKSQMKKIFQLFYRSESELTRETVGTGIGLALVHQMVMTMKGKIDVVNNEVGAEFRLTFPRS